MQEECRNIVRWNCTIMGLYISYVMSRGSDDYAYILRSDGRLAIINYDDLEWLQEDGTLVREQY